MKEGSPMPGRIHKKLRQKLSKILESFKKYIYLRPWKK